MSIFSKIENTSVGSNTFDLTHDVKLTTKFGILTPCCLIDTLPGDRFNIKGNALVRLAPMLAPVMHRANVYIHYFFVPNRIIWSNWEDFITGGRLGTSAPVHPYFNYNPNNTPIGGLADYLGLPTIEDTSADEDMPINAMPLAVYQKVFNDYFRDQNLQDDVPYELIDGAQTEPNLAQIRRRAWQHDYLTSALPWTQRGVEAMLPLGSTAPLIPIINTIDAEVHQLWRDAQSPYDGISNTSPAIESGTGGRMEAFGTAQPGYVGVEDSHEVDLSAATASSIIDLRRAFKLQEWLEKNARGGSRYIEQMQVHFGVRSSDKRLQRAEYIGGFQTPIKISEVLQTSGTFVGGDTPQANMAGHGFSVGGSRNYSYMCEEHGYIIGILSVLPETTYQQGVPRHWFRSDKLDYAFPTFAHIGEQPIYNGEVYLDPGTTTLAENSLLTWGYTPRYAEYKFMQNRVAGEFRSTLDFWHMGRKFTGLPPLNQAFVQMDSAEVDRIFAVEGLGDHLWIQVLNNVKASRKLPVFGTPRL